MRVQLHNYIKVLNEQFRSTGLIFKASHYAQDRKTYLYICELGREGYLAKKEIGWGQSLVLTMAWAQRVVRDYQSWT